MLHYLLAIIIFIHGLIHLMGYSKAFHYTDIKNIKAHISRPVGALWIMACILFIITGILLLINNDYWRIIGIVSIVLSQLVVIMGWKDARYGTIANLLIVAAIIATQYTSLFDK
jgi:hypothetical protein